MHNEVGTCSKFQCTRTEEHHVCPAATVPYVAERSAEDVTLMPTRRDMNNGKRVSLG